MACVICHVIWPQKSPGQIQVTQYGHVLTRPSLTKVLLRIVMHITILNGNIRKIPPDRAIA